MAEEQGLLAKALQSGGLLLLIQPAWMIGIESDKHEYFTMAVVYKGLQV